jgi:hypothetical protein
VFLTTWLHEHSFLHLTNPMLLGDLACFLVGA